MVFVYLFEEAKGLDKFALGGKGYGLVQMASIGLPVPPGMVVSTEACKQYFRTGKVPSGLFSEIKSKLSVVEKKTGKKLGGLDAPLLLSVRSGAPFSMPGMMDSILNLGLNDEVTERMAALTNNKRFAMDAYRRLLQMYGRIALGVPGELFEALLEQRKKKLGVAQDTAIPAGDMEELVHAFKDVIHDRTGKPFPQDAWQQLEGAVNAVFRSWENPRAREYRRYYKISDDLGTAVNIQTMVFGDMGENSGSGVGFTRDPSTGEKRLFGEYLRNSQGEDVVAGTRTPVAIDSVDISLKSQLKSVAEKLERHFRDMQDFEFTVENERLYMLQTRNGKRTAQAAVRIAYEMANEGLITREDAVGRLDPADVDKLLHRTIDPSVKVKPIAKGLNASPGAVSGAVVLDTSEAAAMGGRGEKVILVRPETTPDDIRGVIAAQGVLTARGGMTSHAAVVARGMGKPAVVGCGTIRLHPAEGYFEVEGGGIVKKGDIITIDGTTGTVMLGVVPTVEPQLTPEFRKLLEWADDIRRLGVYANADTPDAAARAREFGAEGIGLCRTERMFNAPDRLKIMQEMILSETVEERSDALRRLVPFQLNDFLGIFRAMKGLPVVVRLLDLPLHEFLPEREKVVGEIEALRKRGAPQQEVKRWERMLEKLGQLTEHNPMLGHRGCRLAVTYPIIYEVQVEAIIRAAVQVRREEGETAKVNIMLPLVSDKNEVVILRGVIDAAAKRTLDELGEDIQYKVGTMIETPRATLTAAEIAVHADFFSFGTNDLTQATFAFSRDDAEAKFMAKYLEEKILPESPFEVLDTEGVGKLVALAVADGRRAKPNLEVGICGEHGGEPRSIAFFNSVGLDYVSCSGFRIPVARLAAAQAVLKGEKGPSSV
ncbi:MAG: pyruvate, phosphate dikinase [Nitrososphaerales archaeon]|nr:pyruvate, phosphate dikinase [Nitrososphaerales archaeon]